MSKLSDLVKSQKKVVDLPKDLSLTEIEVLKIENLQLKKDKVRMAAAELDSLERKISEDISERLDVDAKEYTIDMSKKMLVKKDS